MDFSSSLLQLQDSSAFMFDCQNLLDQSYAASDAGYFSACGSLSPASSTDSCCFSPPSFPCGSGQENLPENLLLESTSSSSSQEENKKAKPARRTGRPRSKCPGIKRQSASEREKLRMRDLTKALHHLRNYLPPSVAPVGQTLTKIETLRLTIHYISHLSAQLELGQAEVAQVEAPSPSAPDGFHPENFQVNNQVNQPDQSFPTQELLNMSSYQNAECSLPSSPAEDYWFPQQQHCYYGQC